MTSRASTCELCGRVGDEHSTVPLYGGTLSSSGQSLRSAVAEFLHLPPTWSPNPGSVLCSSCHTAVAEVDFHRRQASERLSALEKKREAKERAETSLDCLNCGRSELGLVDAILGEGYELKPYRYNFCWVCTGWLNGPELAESHFAEHHPAVESHAFLCLFCLSGFASYSELSTHVLLTHLKDDRGEPTVGLAATDEETRCRFLAFCRICDERFLAPAQLLSHFQQAHPGFDPYSCPACGHGFGALGEYRKHLRNEGQKLLNENYLGQEWDGLTWAEFDALPEPDQPNSVHKLNENAESWTANAEIAGDGLDSIVDGDGGRDQDVEGNDVVGVVENLCPVCAVPVSGSVGAHLKTQHGMKSASCCDLCGDWSVCKEAYKDHRRKVHGMGDEREPAKCCEHCGKLFSRKRALLAHLVAKHNVRPEGMRVHECELCGKMFARENKYNDHVLSHAGVKKYACELCDYRTIQLSNLKTHMQRMHAQPRE